MGPTFILSKYPCVDDDPGVHASELRVVYAVSILNSVSPE